MTYHPSTPLIRLVRHDIRENRDRIIIPPALNMSREFIQLRNRIRFKEVFVVEVIKQNIESLLRINNVLFKLSRCFALNAL